MSLFSDLRSTNDDMLRVSYRNPLYFLDDNWTTFADPLATCATPFRAIYLPIEANKLLGCEGEQAKQCLI